MQDKILWDNTLPNILFINSFSTFNEYYRDNKIAKADSDELRNARLIMADGARIVIKSALNLLGIDVLEQM